MPIPKLMLGKNKKGFVALTIVLSVAGILLATVYSSSIRSGSFFDQAMRKEYREMNYYFAYDCIDQAMLFIAHDYFFEPKKPLFISQYHCYILSVEKNGNLRKIKTMGDFMKASVYREAVVMVGDRGVEITPIN